MTNPVAAVLGNARGRAPGTLRIVEEAYPGPFSFRARDCYCSRCQRPTHTDELHKVISEDAPRTYWCVWCVKSEGILTGP